MADQDVVRRYWEELWGASDAELVDDLFSEPYTRHNRSGTQRLTRSELKAILRRYWIGLGLVVTVRIDHLSTDADGHVWSRVTVFGSADDERSTTVAFLHESRVEGDRIAETWTLSAGDVDWSV